MVSPEPEAACPEITPQDPTCATVRSAAPGCSAHHRHPVQVRRDQCRQWQMDAPRNELPRSLASARYSGQMKNIARRHGEHQHQHGDVTAVSFAGCGQEMLDDYECAAIKAQEHGHDLPNKLLTDLPGGEGPLEIVLSDTVRSDIATETRPWDGTSRSTVQLETSGSKSWRLWTPARRPDYHHLRRQLARHVRETITSPAHTAGDLWTLTAYPSKARTKDRRRRLTLNVSNVEALNFTEFVLEDGGTELEWVLNAWPGALAGKLGPHGRRYGGLGQSG